MGTCLKSAAEKQAEKAEELQFCKGVKLLYIKENVEKLLSCIGKNGIFDEYTLHDISHVDEMLKIVDWLIPERTKKAMTAAEWLMLTLGIYFHDLGMVVTKKEYNDRNNSQFSEYKEEILKQFNRNECEHADDRFLYQEFVRENHAKRICAWIEGKNRTELGDAEDVFDEIQKMLVHLDVLFKQDLALICESHHLDDIDDFAKYRTASFYSSDNNAKVNLSYIAVILRIADLLHITRDRTPSISMRMFNVSNPVSILEWKKQQAVRAIVPRKSRNKDGHIDDSLEKDTIEVTAYFNGPDTAEAYFGLTAYLKYVQSELIRCNGIAMKAKKTEGTTEYDFPWQKVDESQITANGFETKKLQFVLDQENILRLLVGHTLYNDSSVVVRELTQNAIDAVRLQKEYEKKLSHNNDGVPGKISIVWNSRERTLSFTDNGTGMTISDIENYLLKVGASKYQDSDIKKQFPDFSSISHFGIGILTCFMVADSIDITTCSPDQNQATIVNLRNVNGNYLVRKVDKHSLTPAIQTHGTTVTLQVRNDVDMSTLTHDLRKWIVLPEVPVFLREDDQDEIRIGYDSLSDVLKEYLASNGITVDHVNYDIYETTNGSVTMAFAIRYQHYLCDWELMDILEKASERASDKGLFPIGTCIEGIRVEFSTPGYKEPHMLAIANIKGSKYKTNVARSAMELEGNQEFLADIYSGYRQYLEKQISLLRNRNYSDSWALSEGCYLMQHLLHGHRKNTPIDQDILIQNFATLDCLIVENGGKRKCVSAEQVRGLDEVNLFDCAMLRAVELLFKEIRSSASLESVLNAVCDGGDFLHGAKNILCNYGERNILHDYALQGKNVSYISVDRKHRRIQLTYSNYVDMWKEYFSNIGISESIFVPSGEFNIEGIDNEVGVGVGAHIYLKSGTELCRYIIRTLERLATHKQAKTLTNLFISYVVNFISPNKFYRDGVLRVKSEVNRNEYFWEVIDRRDFSNVVLAKTHSVYSTHNWTRKPVHINFDLGFDFD